MASKIKQLTSFDQINFSRTIDLIFFEKLLGHGTELHKIEGLNFFPSDSIFI